MKRNKRKEQSKKNLPAKKIKKEISKKEEVQEEIEPIDVDFSFYKTPIIIAAAITVVFYLLVFIFVK